MVLWDPHMEPSSRWKAALSTGQLMASACDRSFEMSRGGQGRKGRVPESRPVALLDFPVALDFLQSEHHEAVVRVPQTTIHGQSWRHSLDSPQEPGPVERALQVHGQQASSSVIVVALKPSSDGQWPRSRFSVPNCNCVEAACHAFGHCGQQGLRRKTSKSLTHRRQAVAAVLLFQCRERCAGDSGHNGAWDVARGHDADHAVEGPHHLIPVRWDEPSPPPAPHDVAGSAPMVLRPSPTRRIRACPMEIVFVVVGLVGNRRVFFSVWRVYVVSARGSLATLSSHVVGAFAVLIAATIPADGEPASGGAKGPSILVCRCCRSLLRGRPEESGPRLPGPRELPRGLFCRCFGVVRWTGRLGCWRSGGAWWQM